METLKYQDKSSLDKVQYPSIELGKVAPGWAAVPVKVNDNGFEYQARLIVGLVGIRSSSSGELTEDGSIGNDTLQSEVGWRMMKLRPESETVEVP